MTSYGVETVLERSDAPRHAAQLDATATQNQGQPDDELKAKRDKAIEDQKDARAVTEREVEEARTAAEERKGTAAEAAQKRAAAAKQQADEPAAAQLKNSAEAATREEQATIRAAEQKATGCRAQARRCSGKTQQRCQQARTAGSGEEMADVEKQKRQSERANDA